MTPERKVVVTIPGMPCISHDQYDIDGIRVERFTTAPKDAAQRPPLICVHGGCHASWSWQEHAPVYAAAGYEVHALNWRGRGGSAAINDDLFVNMSIADVVDDIDKVARCFDTPPVLIAHSMGGLAAQLDASAHEVGALVLLTPVVPSNVGATPIELPIGDMDAPWGPPPPDVARQMFFQGLDDMLAAHFNALLVPESPLRVYEATRWSLVVDATKLTAPILIVSGALDILTPPETGAALAALYGATYQLEPAHGHNVLLGDGARRIAEDVIAWVVGRPARRQAYSLGYTLDHEKVCASAAHPDEQPEHRRHQRYRVGGTRYISLAQGEHDIRAKSRRHHRSVARHRRATIESLSAHRLSSDRQFSFNAQERRSGDPGDRG